MNDPDAILMLAFARGDEEAFVQLYRSYRDRIVSYCGRMLGDRAQAEEAAQDVFIKLWNSRATYEARSRFSTFLYRIATHHCWNLSARLDGRLTQRGIDMEARATETRDGFAELGQDELRRALTRGLTHLPENQRAALLLVHYEGLSYRDACEAIDVSESAIKSLIHRARATMMRELESFAALEMEDSHAV